jgi:hypothetical protein
MGDESSSGAHPRSGARGFTAGMAAADDDNVEGIRSGNHGGTSIPEF